MAILILSCVLAATFALVLLAIGHPGWAAGVFAVLVPGGLLAGGLCEAAGRADEEMEDALKK